MRGRGCVFHTGVTDAVLQHPSENRSINFSLISAMLALGFSSLNFHIDYRSRRRARGDDGAVCSAHSQAALSVLLSDLLGDSQLPGETLRGGAATSRRGACPAPRGAGDSEK